MDESADLPWVPEEDDTIATESSDLTWHSDHTTDSSDHHTEKHSNLQLPDSSQESTTVLPCSPPTLSTTQSSTFHFTRALHSSDSSSQQSRPALSTSPFPYSSSRSSPLSATPVESSSTTVFSRTLVLRLEPTRFRARVRAAPYTLGPFGPPPPRTSNSNLPWFLGWISPVSSDGLRSSSSSWQSVDRDNEEQDTRKMFERRLGEEFIVDSEGHSTLPPDVCWHRPWYLAMDQHLYWLSACVRTTPLVPLVAALVDVDNSASMGERFVDLMEKQ